jgi:hypothetical protein
MTPKELRELAGHLLEIHDSQTHEEQEELDLSDAVSVLREYADLKELLQAKFTSGNSVPVERIVITRAEVAPLLALKGDKP